mgnify:CR=1 FL=1
MFKNLMMIYLNLKEKKRYEEEVKVIDLSTRLGVLEFWKKLLPETIVGINGKPEYTIPYILRHTQLLPRQLLVYLNAIFSESISRTKSAITPPRSNLIIDCIRKKEGEVAAQIIDSYRKIWPGSESIIRNIFKKLTNNVMNLKELREASKVIDRKIKDIHLEYTPEEVIHLLTELGVIGRVIRETDKYIQGRFEYSEPHKLSLIEEERICLHPVFCEHFDLGDRIRNIKDDFMPVYPYGIDPNEIDRREEYSWF